MTPGRSAAPPTRVRAVLARLLYWVAVLAVSLVLVFLLLTFLEARDEPQVEQPGATVTVGPSIAISNGAA